MTEIPGLYFTHDGYADAAVFGLNQYARHWPESAIRFVVPVNSEEMERRLREDVAPSLDIAPLRCSTPIKATLLALDAAAGDAEWVFWCSSDRFPVAALPEALDAATQAIAERPDMPELAGVNGVRFVRWKDVAGIDMSSPARLIGGLRFHVSNAAESGFWHPHFLRRSWLKALIAVLPEEPSLMDVQAQVVKLNETLPLTPLIADRSLMKLEEPMRTGSVTLNYAARLGRLGKPADRRDVIGMTVAFSCLDGASNNHWRKFGKDVQGVLAPFAGELPLHVVSVGGVGSKRVVKWLYPDAPQKLHNGAHSHRRVPPTQVGPGQRFIYVFGDPRNTVVSIFNRREVRHDRHGFHDVNPVREAPAPEFAMLHAANLEVNPAPMTRDWDLLAYLRAQRDIFRLEEHFDFWAYAEAPYEVVFVRYETLWSNIEKLGAYLGAFLGATGAAPDFRARASDWRGLEPEARGLIDTLHGSFARRLEALPDVFCMREGVATTLDGQPVRFEIL